MGDSDSSSPGEGGSKEGASSAAAGVKLLLGKGKVAVAVPEERWDPASSSDWDKERYTAEALVRIKR